VRQLNPPQAAIARQEKGNQVNQIGQEVEWARLLIEYVKDKSFPEDRKEAKKIQKKVAKYVLQRRVLYKRSFTLLIWCVSTQEANYVQKEIHEGICRNHSGGRALANKALKAGYY
jgi:hypothetical protein